jgi:DNA-binding GntR family transcriptional regulator
MQHARKDQRMNKHWYVYPRHGGCAILNDDGDIIAQRMKKRDAERIVKAVNEHAALVKRAGDAERTVKLLRAYIRTGEVNVLNSIRRGIHSEAI